MCRRNSSAASLTNGTFTPRFRQTNRVAIIATSKGDRVAKSTECHSWIDCSPVIVISWNGKISPVNPCGVTRAPAMQAAANSPQVRTTSRQARQPPGQASTRASRPNTPVRKKPNT